MTIVEAITKVLKESAVGMTALDIYNKIIEENLYTFGAKKPAVVVNGEIRRRCYGLDFPTAYPNKLFAISGYNGRTPLFTLYNDTAIEKTLPKTIHSEAGNDKLPEEKMSEAYNEHISGIRQQIFDIILKNSASFFEHLVMDLLLNMGYGYDKNAGKVTGRSHDGGIDGIINEDKLGLDTIYIQAKRYGNKSVGRKEVQAFVGAMENVHKGVFITTSKFSKEAVDFIKRQQKSIKLIDGAMLSDLLVKYKVGISEVRSLPIYKIDMDYYGE